MLENLERNKGCTNFRTTQHSKGTPTVPSGTPGPSHRSHPTVYYGWIIVAVGFVTLGAAFGVWYSFSVFLLAIIKEFGWSRAAASSIFSIFVFSQAVMNLLTGHLQDRFGPRIVIPAGAIILALALGFTSRANSLTYYAVTYGLFAGIGVSLIGFASHAAFIPKWFEKQRGLAVGIAMSGIGLGMLLIIPAVEMAISRFGWRTTYMGLAGFILLLVGPLNLLFARRNPAALGLRPDGDIPGREPVAKTNSRRIKVIDTAWAQNDWTIAKALGTSRFWFLAFAFFFLAFAYQGTLLHAVSAMVDQGLESETAAYFFGILGVAGSFGKIVLGYLSDIYGRERINTLGVVLASTGILCLANSGIAPNILPLLFALFFGLGYGAAAPLLPSLCADIFQGNSFGLIFATIAVGGGTGGALGPLLAGHLYDMSGSYTTPLSMFIGSLATSCTMVWLAAPSKVRRLVRQQYRPSIGTTD